MKNQFLLLCEQPTIFNNSRFCHKFIIRAHQIFTYRICTRKVAVIWGMNIILQKPIRCKMVKETFAEFRMIFVYIFLLKGETSWNWVFVPLPPPPIHFTFIVSVACSTLASPLLSWFRLWSWSWSPALLGRSGPNLSSSHYTALYSTSFMTTESEHCWGGKKFHFA